MGNVKIPWGWVLGAAFVALTIDHYNPGLGQFVGGLSQGLFK